jgi:hypothetical protein
MLLHTFSGCFQASAAMFSEEEPAIHMGYEGVRAPESV